jgi:hypothetical protein
MYRFMVIMFWTINLQLPFIAAGWITLFALFTFNVKLIVILALISTIQYPIKKSKWVIEKILKYVPPTLYYRSYTRYY